MPALVLSGSAAPAGAQQTTTAATATPAAPKTPAISATSELPANAAAADAFASHPSKAGSVEPATDVARAGDVARVAGQDAQTVAGPTDDTSGKAQPTAGQPFQASTLTAGSDDPADARVGSYTNAVTEGYSIDFPDPAVIRGKDGYWYGYSTGGPYDDQGERNSTYKIARSKDLTQWEEVGSVFDEKNRPSWASEDTGFWAPDVRYVNGQYLLYFTVPDTTTTDADSDPAIGVATAPTPAGPWKPSEKPLIPPRKDPSGGWDTTIDPALFTDDDGTQYLYWGGYGTGDYVVKLSGDGTKTVGEPTKVATSRFEGPYVMKRDGWYYLFASSGNCCAGPTTGYAVFVGRSKSPRGPFVDKNGTSLLDSRAGGTPVINQNGNRWIGTGHHSAVTDFAGQTWMTYHAIDRADPWLDTEPGFTMRGMNLDRLDWIDGWPTVRAGKGPSAGPQQAPVTTAEVDERFNDPASQTLVPHTGDLRRAGPDQHSGPFAKLQGEHARALSSRPVSSADVRVEADVRGTDGATGVTARYHSRRHHLTAYVDPERDELRVEARAGSDVRQTTAPLPDGFDHDAWHTLALQARGDQVSVDVTNARQSDPWATATLDLPQRLDLPGRAGVVAEGGGDVDNVAAQPLYEPVRQQAPTPKPGVPDPSYSDEFDGDAPDRQWSWVREDDSARVAGGALNWPTQNGDLVGDGGDGTGVLLRDAPKGEYTVETKLSIDTGVDDVRDFQQGGLVAYAGDDEFLRHDVVATGDTRIVEYGKETTFQDRLSWGGSLVGPPGQTTWLRLHHTVDSDTGEHHFRAASSTNGQDWTWGGTWTMPAHTDPRIGLVSQGSNPETNAKHGRATSAFDYVRIFRP